MAISLSDLNSFTKLFHFYNENSLAENHSMTQMCDIFLFFYILHSTVLSV